MMNLPKATWRTGAACPSGNGPPWPTSCPPTAPRVAPGRPCTRCRSAGCPSPSPRPCAARNWSRRELYHSPPGESPLALLQAALEGGCGVPLLLKLDPPGCAPALDAALFALSSHLPSTSGESEEASAQALSAALLALVESGADLEARNGDVAERLHAALHLPRGEAGEMLWDDERELSKRYLGLRGIADCPSPSSSWIQAQAARSGGPPVLVVAGGLEGGASPETPKRLTPFVPVA